MFPEVAATVRKGEGEAFPLSSGPPYIVRLIVVSLMTLCARAKACMP